MRTVVSFWLSVFVCVQMHAMEQKRLVLAPPWPTPAGSARVQAPGIASYVVEPVVLRMLQRLQDEEHVAQRFATSGQQIQHMLDASVDPIAFSTVLAGLRTSLAGGDYKQRVTNVIELLQRECPTELPINELLILDAVIFLQAQVKNPFGDALALHCARVLPTIAGHLGKPYYEWPQDGRDKIMRLHVMLHHALTEPGFTVDDPSQALPPLAQEILKNKESRTRGEIEGLLCKHTDLQYLEDLPGIATVESLALDNNTIAALSTKASCLPSLKNLWLDEHTKVASLSGEIGKFSTLTYLCCIRNDLRSLPETIGDLYNLVELPLYQNKLTSVPRSIGKLSSLWRLALRENQIASLPNEIGRLCSLVSLSLDDNQLTSVPSSIGQLTLLTFLGLHNNRLTSLPDEICGLKELRALSLFGNDISRLPQSVGKLCRLQNLSLDKDRLVLGEATRIGTVLSRCRICERV